MFSVPTKNKTALFAMFSLPRAPKSSQNIGFWLLPKHRYLRHNMSEMLYFTVFLEHLFKNTGIYSVLWKHARNTVNTNEFKDYIFHGNKPQTAKTLLFTAFLRNDFSKKTCFLDHFWRLKPPKTKSPFHILNFKIFTKSKTLQFLELKTRPGPHFLTVFTMFFARA